MDCPTAVSDAFFFVSARRNVFFRLVLCTGFFSRSKRRSSITSGHFNMFWKDSWLLLKNNFSNKGHQTLTAWRALYDRFRRVGRNERSIFRPAKEPCTAKAGGPLVSEASPLLTWRLGAHHVEHFETSLRSKRHTSATLNSMLKDLVTFVGCTIGRSLCVHIAIISVTLLWALFATAHEIAASNVYLG